MRPASRWSGSLVYLALRRWGPAAGSLAAGSSLVIMALVSLVVLGPWPRWWVLAPETSHRRDAAICRAVERLDETRLRLERNGRCDRQPTVAAPDADSRLAGQSATERLREADHARRLFGELSRELRRPAAARPARWGWPEWLAAGFLASLGLGLARLGPRTLGHRASSRREAGRSTTASSNDAIEILGPSCRCPRRVEVRETAELSTPATIGWRRPLLLLPGDWRDWSPAERRARAGARAGACPSRRFPGGPRGPARPGAALLSSPGALAGGPAPAGAGAGGRRLGARLSGGKTAVSRDARPDGPAPRQPRLDLAGPCVPSLTWHLCSEDRDAAQFQANPSRSFPSRHGC